MDFGSRQDILTNGSAVFIDCANERKKEEYMKKINKVKFSAKSLLKFLKDLEEDGVNLAKVSVNYRYNHDSDVREVLSVEEDLFDAKDCSTLTSICLVTEPGDQ
jgi:hypothetical protein